MEKFHIVVLTVAAIILILVLIFIGILLSNSRSANVAYPPTYGICPDYWEIAPDSSKCIIPNIETQLNIGNMYDDSMALKESITTAPGYSYDMSNNEMTKYIDFADPDWKGVCGKKIWTNLNGIVWDGISNYNSC
jgi:hypothetical protein